MPTIFANCWKKVFAGENYFCWDSFFHSWLFPPSGKNLPTMK